MKEKIEVKMTSDYLFDFLLFHTYSTFMGFLTNILGLAVILMGLIRMVYFKDGSSSGFYIAAGIMFMGFTPLQLMLRARTAVKKDSNYNRSYECEFNDNGINILWQGTDEKKKFSWDRIKKVVFAPKTVGFYYSEAEAIIIPKENFGKCFGNIMNLAVKHTPIGTVKVREFRNS